MRPLLLLVLAACTSEISIYDPGVTPPAVVSDLTLDPDAPAPSVATADDVDADRVPNLDDLCPDEAGVAWFDGCPDADADLVPEPWDACPAEPVPAHTRPEYTDGCPGLVRVSGDVLLHPGIPFVRNEEVLAVGAARTLDAVADLLLAYPGITGLRVEAHTDDGLSPDEALAITDLQAAVVVDELAARGVDPVRLIADGRGSAEPRGDGEGEARHRRVELVVVGDVGLPAWW
jgi:outer membrane protein OmpA-like peptidoglycan-associated protein